MRVGVAFGAKYTTLPSWIVGHTASITLENTTPVMRFTRSRLISRSASCLPTSGLSVSSANTTSVGRPPSLPPAIFSARLKPSRISTPMVPAGPDRVERKPIFSSLAACAFSANAAASTASIVFNSVSSSFDSTSDPVDLALVRLGGLGRHHGGEARLLLRRVLRDGIERVLQHRLVVRADRTNVRAAPAAGDHPGAAQDALPKVEAVLRAQHGFLLLGVGLVDHAPEIFGQLREAVRRAVLVARVPVALPLADHVARTRLETAAAFRSEAERFGHRPVALDVDRAEHRREEHPRPELLGEELFVETERPQPGFHRGM